MMVEQIKQAQSHQFRKESVLLRKSNFMKEKQNLKTDKITYLGFLSSPPRIVMGSKGGYITIYLLSKREKISIFLDSEDEEQATSSMTKILQVVELPSKVADAKKYIFYVLSHGNLYAMSKEGRQIQQVFYKGEKVKYDRPRLLQAGVLVMENQYALALIVEGGSLLMLDPMSL